MDIIRRWSVYNGHNRINQQDRKHFKIESISSKIEGKNPDETRMIIVDEIIKLEYRIFNLQDELKYTFQKINQLKDRNNNNHDLEKINIEKLKEQNELLMRENLNLIQKVHKLNDLNKALYSKSQVNF